jgi:hypothetical protein
MAGRVSKQEREMEPAATRTENLIRTARMLYL